MTDTSGMTLQELAEALRAAFVEIFGSIFTWGWEPQTPEQDKAPRPHPCPDAGPLRPPKSTRTAYAARVQRIRPQARSAIKQRRNRRRE